MSVILTRSLLFVTTATLLVPSAFAIQTVSSTINGTYVIGPEYTTDPATEECLDCEHGLTFDLQMPFKDSSYYNCDPDDNPTLSKNCSNGFCGQTDETQTWRKIGVYIPASYNDGDETGVMIRTDYSNHSNVYDLQMMMNIMENLNNSNDDERSLPSFILIGVPYGIGDVETTLFECRDGGGSERRNHYETMSDKYARFVADELFPFVTNHPDIKSKYSNLRITDDPAGRAAYGCSHGGVAAFKMAFFRPDLFGIVIAYSTSLVEMKGDPELSEEYPLGNAEFWVPKPEGQELIKSVPKKPIRIFHSANDWDFGTPNSCMGGHPFPWQSDSKYQDWALANNETAAALTAMGYETRYAYGLDACHCDQQMMAQDMPNTLVWAWANWKKKQASPNNDDNGVKDEASGASFAMHGCLTVIILALILIAAL